MRATRVLETVLYGADIAAMRAFYEGVIGLDAWKQLGQDRHSLVADPMCADPREDDFTLAPDSPAIAELGFEPIDLSDVGPRPVDERE